MPSLETRPLRDNPIGFRYFHLLSMAFVMSLLVSDTIAVKIITWAGFTLPAGIIVFPVAYIFGDVLTEVYGFERTRSVIWFGFICLAAMAIFYYVATLLPPAGFWTDQAPFARLFGFVPRIVVASFIAYLIGEFLNSVVLSRMKIATNGKHFWLRAVGSTLVGEGADSIVFNSIAFAGVMPLKVLGVVMFSGWLLKCLYEVVALPLTYAIVGWLKRAEGIDTYDRGVRYTVLPTAPVGPTAP
jgi:uncharacterized integral membrane protein (TIGR00697 family)